MANLLSDTINYIQPFCRYQGAAVGTGSMPIIGIANIVRSVVLAAPFTWRFNRNSVNLVGSESPIGIAQGVQDYVQKIPGFGFLEKATANDGTTSWEIKDIKNTEALGSSTTQARPEVISVFSEDVDGNITFRLSGVPNKILTINMIYQMGPGKFTTISDSWAPIPDSFSDIYNHLCLGFYMDSCQDPRGSQYIARGIAGLLGRAQGLTAMDKALFAASYLNFSAQQMIEMMKAQQGQQAQAGK
jgi:hypothetical protein